MEELKMKREGHEADAMNTGMIILILKVNTI